MSELLGTAASIIELANLAHRASSSLINSVRPAADERAFIAVLDAAIIRAINDTPEVPVREREAVFALLRKLITKTDSKRWMRLPYPGRTPDERHTIGLIDKALASEWEEVASTGANVSALLVRFQTYFWQEFERHASRANSPLHNLYTVSTIREIGDLVRDISQSRPSAIEEPVTIPFQPPPDVADFTGRSHHVSVLRATLLHSTNKRSPPVVLVTGRAGVGKTTLAVHVAHGLRDTFADGMLYIDLRGVGARKVNPYEVLGEFLRALGVDGANIPSAPEERLALYRTTLSGKHMLLLLDNAANEAQVRPLIPSTFTVSVMVTSRFSLAGLNSDKLITLGGFTQEEAFALLRIIVGSERIDSEPEGAKAIIRLCGYLPLAVRVIGAKLRSKRHWKLATMENRLSDTKRRLRELRAGDVEVGASFLSSYEDLPEDQRRLFRLVSLPEVRSFPSWVVAALLDVDVREAEDAIESLVDAHLVDAATEDPSGSIRYKFHDLLLDYARERLEEEETYEFRQAALGRVLGAYLALADRAEDLFQHGVPRYVASLGASRWRAPDDEYFRAMEQNPAGWFLAERVNLVGIIRQSYNMNLLEHTWELASQLVSFFDAYSFWSDWERTHEYALAAAQRASNRGWEAVTLRNLGDLYREQGDFGKAAEYFGLSLSILNELQDPKLRARVLHGLGETYRDQGRLNDAAELLREASVIFAGINDSFREAITLFGVAGIRRAQGRFEEAVSLLLRCRSTFAELDDRRREALSLRSLGVAYREQGRFNDAIYCYDLCLPVFENLNDRRYQAITLCSIGCVRTEQGLFNEALEHYYQCIQIFKEIQDHRWEAISYSELGALYYEQGRLDDAISCYLRCIPILSRLGDRRWEAISYAGLSAVYFRQGVVRDAIQACERCIPIFRELNDRRRFVRVLVMLGDALSALGRREAASAAYEEARQAAPGLTVEVIRDIKAWIAE